jgi:PhnB protein
MSNELLIEQLDQAISGLLSTPDAEPSPVDPEIRALLRVAADLLYLPRPDFKTDLKADLERKAFMILKEKLRPGFRTITPYLLPPRPEFMDFLKGVFGAEETFRAETGPGRFHAEARIGDSMLMIGVGSNLRMPATLYLYVKDSDETYRRAVQAGATPLTEMVDKFGDHFGIVQDAAGNTWCIATYVGGHSIGQEHLNIITVAFSLRDSAKFIDFLKQAFGGQEIVRYDSPEGEVKHAKIRIGESVIAAGEAHGVSQPTATMIYMYVPDCDAVYERALQAGAKSILRPVDQPYGDRQGAVEDPWGNQWYISTPL